MDVSELKQYTKKKRAFDGLRNKKKTTMLLLKADVERLSEIKRMFTNITELGS